MARVTVRLVCPCHSRTLAHACCLHRSGRRNLAFELLRSPVNISRLLYGDGTPRALSVSSADQATSASRVAASPFLRLSRSRSLPHPANAEKLMRHVVNLESDLKASRKVCEGMGLVSTCLGARCFHACHGTPGRFMSSHRHCLTPRLPHAAPQVNKYLTLLATAVSDAATRISRALSHNDVREVVQELSNLRTFCELRSTSPRPDKHAAARVPDADDADAGAGATADADAADAPSGGSPGDSIADGDAGGTGEGVAGSAMAAARRAFTGRLTMAALEAPSTPTNAASPRTPRPGALPPASTPTSASGVAMPSASAGPPGADSPNPTGDLALVVPPPGAGRCLEATRKLALELVGITKSLVEADVKLGRSQERLRVRVRLSAPLCAAQLVTEPRARPLTWRYRTRNTLLGTRRAPRK